MITAKIFISLPFFYKCSMLNVNFTYIYMQNNALKPELLFYLEFSATLIETFSIVWHYLHSYTITRKTIMMKDIRLTYLGNYYR